MITSFCVFWEHIFSAFARKGRTMTDNIKEFTPEVMAELTARAVGDVDLASREIPDLDLYIDQILTLVSGKTAASSDRYKENHLTKTMINNYSKEGLISPVKGKKYTKEHIIQMLLIYALKNSLSIGEIKRLLKGVYLEGFDGEALTECYDRFLDIKTESRTRAVETAQTLISEEGLSLDDSRDFCVALLGLVACSAYLRNIAVEMLEARYPMPEAKSEEKPKSKEKKSKEADAEGKE